MEIAPLKKKKRENLCMFVFPDDIIYQSARFTTVLLCTCAFLALLQRFYIFFFFWIALLHRRRTENIIGSGALGGLRGGDMAHASHLIFLWIYNTRIILPISTIYCRIHTFDIYLLVSIPNDSIRFDSTRLYSVSDFTKFDVLLSESKSVSCRLDCTQTNLVV